MIQGCYGKRLSYKNYSEQDLILALSKNSIVTEGEKGKKSTLENDVIIITKMELPNSYAQNSKTLSNFYNCVNSHQASYLRESSLVIV